MFIEQNRLSKIVLINGKQFYTISIKISFVPFPKYVKRVADKNCQYDKSLKNILSQKIFSL